MTETSSHDWLTGLRTAVLNGDARTAAATTGQALAAGIAPQTLVDEALIPAMDEAGRLFDAGEFFVPELLVASRALKAAQALITPRLAGSAQTSHGRVVIGTVKGDLHDIGKNLVVALLQGAGFEVIDLGSDVPPDAFVAAIRDKRPHLVGLSALLTTTMMQMQQTVRALEQAGQRAAVQIMIGGAPVTRRFADQVGADGYADNAASAVILARELMGRVR
jgi:corrinoid protein of di/trimethylamine methyltransferase